jgi:hypothetical protein
MHIQADHSGNESVGPRFTVDELRLAIATLSAADLGRLKQAAKVFSGISGIMEDDLIQDSYTRVLEGRRTCGRTVGLVPFLCGVMKSIASQETEARKVGLRPVTVLKNGEAVLPDGKADTVSPEQAAAAAIDDRPLLARVHAAIAGDEKLELLLEGIYDQMRGAELQDLLGVDEKGLAALRKKLKRRLQEASAERTT